MITCRTSSFAQRIATLIRTLPEITGNIQTQNQSPFGAQDPASSGKEGIN
jgi:hypothetical protein